MMRRTVVTIALMVLVVGLAGAGDTARQVVLKDGRTLEVRDARIAGGMVYVTLPSGEMRAYSLPDVDLEASGLVPAATGAETEQGKVAPPSLVDLAKKERGTPRVTITDADVAHVEPTPPAPAPGDEALAQEKGKGALTVAVSGYERKGQELTVKGRVANQGTVPISGIRLEAEVKNGAGKIVRRAQKAIEGTVEGGKAKDFQMTFELPDEDIAGVNVRVVGAVAPVQMKRPAPAEEQGTPSEE